MKKGFSYIDVAVSVGIFVVALVIAFVLMKPALRQENTGGLLLPSLKSGFENSTFWTISRIPFFLNSTDGNYLAYNISVPYNLNSNNVNLLCSNLSNVTFYYVNYNIPSGPVFLLQFPISIDPKIKAPFYIEYSKDLYYPLNHVGDLPLGGLYSTNFASPSSYNYTFGLEEDLTGISIPKFNNLTESNYNNLKSQFGIPNNNDFSILVSNINNNTAILNYNVKSPDVQSAVYVLEYTSFILYDNTTRMPVIISLKVW